jgi:hypothetical protein
MADVVDLRSRQPISHEDEFNSELVTDLARFSEGGLITEKEIRRRYRFDDAVWESLATNEALFAAIEDEKTKRVRSGALKRERSQVLITKAPDILDAIATDATASPRHRVDAIKTLDNFCANGPEAAPADRYVIQINIGDISLEFNKSIKPDINPHHIDDTPQEERLPVIAANKRKDDGGGEFI